MSFDSDFFHWFVSRLISHRSLQLVSTHLSLLEATLCIRWNINNHLHCTVFCTCSIIECKYCFIKSCLYDFMYVYTYSFIYVLYVLGCFAVPVG